MTEIHTGNKNTGSAGYSAKNIVQIKGTELPYLLNQIPDKPKTMYVCGNAKLLSKECNPSIIYLCVIGSRKYTSYGYDACTRLVSSLKGRPVVIVSGLALGIDGIAHRTALDVGLPCIAVPGSGLDPDILYPRSHVSLAEEIVAKGGALISEYDPQFRATPWSFPVRNRIMAGLSHAVLIIEGERDSGTLITARLALEYNRDVLAIPGSIFSSASEGPLSLIKRGAVPICNENDLAQALGFEIIGTAEDATPENERYSRCSEEELSVLNLLNEPLSREDLLNASGMELSKLQIVLSMLEIHGLIVEEYGHIRRSLNRI